MFWLHRVMRVLFSISVFCSLLADCARAGVPSFRTEVMAAISKAGCNLGTCHGNATGKGGFKLSLRGQDVDFDHASLTHDVAGRRVNLFSPEESLLLLKGANKLAHEGGKRLDPMSWEYGVLRDWIASGAGKASASDVRVSKIEVTPREATLDEPVQEVQIQVKAVFPDGSRRDVTAQAVYEPLQTGLVDVSREGLVKRRQFGEPTVLVRYLNHAQPVRLLFVKANPSFQWQKPRQQNYVDGHIFAKLKLLRMNPSGVCGDEVFIRRAYLDLTGQIPTASEARDFVKDESPEKRALLVDRLMARPEFADFWASRWADVLKVESRTLDEKGMKTFHSWIRDAMARNVPLDVFARELIGARGSTYHEAAANFYRANRTPAIRAETTAQVFLGTRLQCAQCHNHPFDRWTQDDYYQWSAVFGRVDYKIIENKRTDKSDTHEFKGEQVVFLNAKLKVENPRTGDNARPRFLGAEIPKLTEGEDELQAAARWLTGPGNPLFAKAQANRIWYYLMGRGLVDPVDDFRLTNPASHPQLLDALAEDLTASGYDLRHLIRVIMLSRTYQLDSTPNESNASDLVNYSHTPPRRITAEQLVDSTHLAFGVTADFEGYAKGTRAAQIPGPRGGRDARNVSFDDDAPEIFLAQFGKPKRELACECERSNDTSISQTFQFISGPMIGKLLAQDKGRVNSWSKKAEADPGEILRDLYWSFLTRAPTDEESKVLTALIASAGDRKQALQDIAWSLVNAKEFLLRR
jgi:hypothetical protein